MKRRYWCRVLVRQPQLLRARLHWRQFIAENKRGLIKRDTLYKQGHLRPNWLKRIFELHDYTFVYKTEGNSTRGSVDIVDKQLAFSNLGALLEENAGWNYGFKLVPEFSYSDYYPRFYEHEEDYEYFENLHNLMLLKRLQQVTGLKSSENKSKASGAKAGDRRSRSLSDASAASLLHIQTGAEPLDLGNHQSHVEGPRLTQSTLGSRAQAQTQVVSTRLGGAGMPVGRSFERPTDVSLNSERPKLTKTASGGGSVFGGSRFGGSMFGGSVFGSGAVFGGPDEHTARRKSISSRTLSSNKLILNSDKRRMHRPYLNMDATSRRQRDEWMDVLRHQIWLVNNANLAVTSTGVGRGTSNMVSESSAMYMVYDVEGSPPTVSGNFKDEKDNALFSYTTTTIDMLVPPPYRMTPNKLVKLPPLYTQFKPPPDPFPNGDVVYVPRSPSPETDHEALLEHQRKHEEYHHQHPHHKLARHSDEVDSEGKEAVSADTGAETASRSWKAFGLIRRVSAVFKSKPESPTLQTEKDSDYGDQADFDAVGSNIDNLTPSADPPPEREPTPEPISTYELPSLLEHGMTMKKRMIRKYFCMLPMEY